MNARSCAHGGLGRCESIAAVATATIQPCRRPGRDDGMSAAMSDDELQRAAARPLELSRSRGLSRDGGIRTGSTSSPVR